MARVLYPQVFCHALLGIAPVVAADEVADTGLPEIVVTAQKMPESSNDVGMSITTATADQLRDRGLSSVEDLIRLVPGFTGQRSNYNSTSFTLRGVGFFNSDLATTPAVTVYVDEAPLPFAAMTRLAAFDLSRVEVLKGPQGTVFGQNATGGAINYVVAKPTDELRSGVDLSYERFDRKQIGGFVSGPIGDHWRARVAGQWREGGPWQRSITRPGDELGRIREWQGRAILDWEPTDSFTSSLMLTATRDQSESAAPQFVFARPRIPALNPPGLLTFPVSNDSRMADWSPTQFGTDEPFPYASDTTLYHTTWRNELQLSETVTAVALTSYADFHMEYGQDSDGTPYYIGNTIDRGGRVESFFQELRLAAEQAWGHWLIGLNYSRDETRDEPLRFFPDFDAVRRFQLIDPLALGDRGLVSSRLHANTSAAFGRVDYRISERVSVEAGVRYNVDRRTFHNCNFVVSDSFARYWNIYRQGAEPRTEIGDCLVMDIGIGSPPVDDVRTDLDEDNLSWRVGANWHPDEDVLLYANVSRGFKAGAVPALLGSTTLQFRSVPQESLLAYEVGVKSSLAQRRVQLNAAAFYYDYRDKQLRGTLLDPIVGPAEALVSIPRSHVAGAEIQLIAQLPGGLTLETAAAYVDSEVDEFLGYDAFAAFGDQSNTPFPFAPKWQSNTNIDYRFPVGGLDGFVGASVTYNSETYTGVGAIERLRIDAFTLLDLRAGVDLDSGRYRLWAWGKNVTDELYWTNVFASANAISRFVGQPATFGLSLSARF
jgi:outer membrane receptor protein involved in Fe transport